MPPGTSYPKWRVTRSDTKTGTFSTLSTITISTDGLSYYDADGTSSHWYKTEYRNQDESTAYDTSDAFQPQSEIYTSVRAVEQFLRLPTLTNTSVPTIQEIVEVIQDKQDEIDDTTRHAWRLRYSGTNSGHDQTAQYEYYDVDFYYERHTGRPVYLKHRKIRTMDADAGDVLEYWNGSDWEDILDGWTEGRDEDYWYNYQMGVLFLKRRYSVMKPMSVRKKYRYGETTVPRHVRRLCTKMVAYEMLYGESKAVILQEGTTNMNHEQKMARWEKDIDSALMRLKEFQIPTKWT